MSLRPSIGGAPDTARDAEANVREVARLFMTLNHLDNVSAALSWYREYRTEKGRG